MSRTPEEAANGCAWMIHVPIILCAWFFKENQILKWLLLFFAYVWSSWMAQHKLQNMRATDKPLIAHKYPLLFSFTPLSHSIWHSLIHVFLFYLAFQE